MLPGGGSPALSFTSPAVRAGGRAGGRAGLEKETGPSQKESECECERVVSPRVGWFWSGGAERTAKKKTILTDAAAFSPLSRCARRCRPQRCAPQHPTNSRQSPSGPPLLRTPQPPRPTASPPPPPPWPLPTPGGRRPLPPRRLGLVVRETSSRSSQRRPWTRSSRPLTAGCPSAPSRPCPRPPKETAAQVTPPRLRPRLRLRRLSLRHRHSQAAHPRPMAPRALSPWPAAASPPRAGVQGHACSSLSRCSSSC